MKVTNEVTIDADRTTVWREFDNPDNRSNWQPMTETITERREPDFMAGSYDSSWSKAIIVNHFEAIGENQTRWAIYANHQFKGIFRVFGPFRRKSIAGRTEEWMQRFKLLVESKLAEESQ